MSLCDTCRIPGKCCFGMELNGGSFGRGMTALEVLAALSTLHLHRDTKNEAMGSTIGLPLIPLYRRPNGNWRFWCPNLGRDGRCQDYENRPALCRDFEPASDQLCLYWKPQDDKCSDHKPFLDRLPALAAGELCSKAEP